jgi:Protein of unknown function (DUF3619)
VTTTTTPFITGLTNGVHGSVQSDVQRAQTLQDQFGLKMAARLSQGAHDVPHDIAERLRVAREQAMSRRKKPVLVMATQSHVNLSGGAASLSLGGPEQLNLWQRLASIMPLIALVVGLIAVNSILNEERANDVAEVDSALLIDDLPPAAYADPGFTQFLKLNKDLSR